MPTRISPRRTGIRAAALLAPLLLAMSAQPMLAADQAEAGKTPRKGTQFVKLHGSSPWVCTPSGFGQKARCYRRSA